MKCAWESDQKKLSSYHSSIAKLFSSEIVTKTATDAMAMVIIVTIQLRN